jgi:hypothetical protein
MVDVAFWQPARYLADDRQTVPAPAATAIGRVILDREAVTTAPAISGGFLQWLHKCGRAKASARNVEASAGRARRLVGGCTFDNLALEIAALVVNHETMPIQALATLL